MPVHIPPSLTPLFRMAGRAQQLPAAAAIFTQGEPASCFYLVASGRVRAFALSSEGQETTLEILEAGRIFGDSSFLAGAERCVTMETVVASEIIVCRAETLVRMCHQSQELMLLLFQHMAETCNYLTHQVTRLAHYNSREKVADFLLCESDSRQRDELPYTHEEIAQSVSLNRVTVSRILADFRAAGWIDSQYGRIRILNREALRAVLPQV